MFFEMAGRSGRSLPPPLGKRCGYQKAWLRKSVTAKLGHSFKNLSITFLEISLIIENRSSFSEEMGFVSFVEKKPWAMENETEENTSCCFH